MIDIRPDTKMITRRGSRMQAVSGEKFTFGRLSELALDDLVPHTSDPRLTEHMPLLTRSLGEGGD